MGGAVSVSGKQKQAHSKAAVGSSGFSVLEEYKAPVKREGIGRLKGYTVQDAGTGGSGAAEEDSTKIKSTSVLGSLASVVEGLRRDKRQRSTTRRKVQRGLTQRALTVLPPFPDEVVTCVLALKFEQFAIGNARGHVLVIDWSAGCLLTSWVAGKRQISVLAAIRGDPVDHELGVAGRSHNIITASGAEIVVWELQGAGLPPAKKCSLQHGHSQEVKSLAVLRAGLGARDSIDCERLISGSRDCTVRIWDLDTAECLHQLHILRNVVTRICVFPAEQRSHNGLAFVQCSEDLRMRFWAVDEHDRLSVRHVFHAGREQIVALDVAPGGMLATGTKGFEKSDCELAVWHMSTMDKRITSKAFDATIEALRVITRASNVLQCLAVSVDTSMRCFSFPDLELLWSETAATCSPYTAIDIAVDSGGSVGIFTTTAAPEVFVWCWAVAADTAIAGKKLRSPAAPLEHPPLLRACGDGQRAVQMPPISDLCLSDNQASTAPGSGECDYGSLQPVPPPIPADGTGLSSLSGLLAKVQQDAAAHEAKQRLKTFSMRPTRTPRRERIKGISPLAHASAQSKEDDIYQIFQEIDQDGNGSIDVVELKEYLGDYLGYGEREIARFMQQATTSQSCNVMGEQIDFPSFRAHYGLLNAVSISHRSDESFLRRPGSIGGQQFCVEECKKCQLMVCDTMDQTFVDQCSGCRILLGPSTASTFVRDCVDCTFWVATQQLRTRGCHRCTFYLYSQTEPVIEKSTNLCFAPWVAAYPLCGEHFRQAGFDPSRNYWNAIFDFTPHPGGKCNWSIVALHKCECVAVTFEELSQDRESVVMPDCPTPMLTHASLCAPPLESEMHTGHGMAALEQVRPELPQAPPLGKAPKLTVEQNSIELADRLKIVLGAHSGEEAIGELVGPTLFQGAVSEQIPTALTADGEVQNPRPEGVKLGSKDVVRPLGKPTGRPGRLVFGSSELGGAAAPMQKSPVRPARPSSARPVASRRVQQEKTGASSSDWVPSLPSMLSQDVAQIAATKERVPAAPLANPCEVQQHAKAKESLASVRQRYVAEEKTDEDIGFMSGIAMPSFSAKVNDLIVLSEDDEDAAVAFQEAQAENKVREQEEQDELEQMWNDATAANFEAAVRPSLWQVAAAERGISHDAAWNQLMGKFKSSGSSKPVAGLDPAASNEKDALLWVAQTRFDDDDVLHLRILQSVWRQLSKPLRTSTKSDVEAEPEDTIGGGSIADLPMRTSAQWQHIGFQGTDPTTDLRGVGVLGLLHLLLLSEQAPSTSAQGMLASHHASRHFPFAVASFNFSKMVVELLMDGKMTSICNKGRSAVKPVSMLYLGAFRSFLTRWIREELTVEHFGKLLKEISIRAARSPQTFIREGERRE